MFGRDCGDADRLNTLWDGTVTGQSAANGSDERDVSTLHWLHARARMTLPSRDFVAHLEQEIAASADHPSVVRHSTPNVSVARSDRFTGFAGTSGRNLRAAAAAIVIVAVLSAVVSFRSALDPSDPAPTFPALAALSSSPVTSAHASESRDRLDMVRFDECTVSPLPDGYVDGLNGDPAELPALTGDRIGPDSDNEPRTQPLISGLPPGDQPSAETLDHIRQTIRMLTACRYYDSEKDGLNGRYFALFSDDAHRREPVRSNEGIGAYWTPRSSIPPEIGDARQLDDDHVVVFVQDNGLLLLVLFVLEGDQWLTDATLGYAVIDSNVLPEAYGETSVDGVETLLLVEEAPGYRGTGTNSVFVAGSRYVFVFHNLGSVPRRFVIDRIDIDVTIPPFETETVTISAPPGDFVFQTFTNGAADAVAEDSCDGWPYPGNALTFYAEPPLKLKDDCGLG